MLPKNMILTGPPGCGKTTIIRKLLQRRGGRQWAGFYTHEIHHDVQHADGEKPRSSRNAASLPRMPSAKEAPMEARCHRAVDADHRVLEGCHTRLLYANFRTMVCLLHRRTMGCPWASHLRYALFVAATNHFEWPLLAICGFILWVDQ